MRTKFPPRRTAFRDAVKAANEAHLLFRRYPAPLIGVATGDASGVDVLDIDQKPQAREWWLENRQRIPPTYTHRTRSGGLHLLFLHAEGLRCSTSRIGVGIDVRADRGCAIWWSAAGFPVLCDAPIEPWPAWLLSQAWPPPPPILRPPVVADDKLMRGILDVVGRAVEGERNKSLYWAARRFANSTLARDVAEAELIRKAIEIGLSLQEADATIRSAFRAGAT